MTEVVTRLGYAAVYGVYNEEFWAIASCELPALALAGCRTCLSYVDGKELAELVEPVCYMELCRRGLPYVDGRPQI